MSPLVKRLQIVDQMTTGIMRDKKVVENSSVAGDQRLPYFRVVLEVLNQTTHRLRECEHAAHATFDASLRSEGNGSTGADNNGILSSSAQQVPRRAASKTPRAAERRNERRRGPSINDVRTEGRGGLFFRHWIV